MFETKKRKIRELEAYLRNSKSKNEQLMGELKLLQEAVDGQLDKVIVRCKNCRYATVLNVYDYIEDIADKDINRSIIACEREESIYTLVEPEHYCSNGCNGKCAVYSVLREWK